MLLKHKEREKIIRVKHNIVESPATQDGWLRGGRGGGRCKLTLQICIKKIASNTLNSVINRKDMNPLPILHIRTLMDRHNITKTDSKISPDNFVHSDFWLLTLFLSKNNANSVSTLLSLHYNKHVLQILKSKTQYLTNPLKAKVTLISTVSPRKN